MKCYTYDNNIIPGIDVDDCGDLGLAICLGSDDGGRFRAARMCHHYPAVSAPGVMYSCDVLDIGDAGMSYHIYREEVTPSPSLVVLIVGADKRPHVHGPGRPLSWGSHRTTTDEVWRLDVGQRLSFYVDGGRVALVNDGGVLRREV
jgi:hypothetical protein